jgi:hypothetical protein
MWRAADALLRTSLSWHDVQMSGHLNVPVASFSRKELQVPTEHESRWAPRAVLDSFQKRCLLNLPRIELRIVQPTALSLRYAGFEFNASTDQK